MADNSGFGFGSDLNPDPNLDFPYEIELGFGSEAMDVLKKDGKNLAA
jgi:hypothetical protein